MRDKIGVITSEVVAGLLWMYLNMPDDISRSELEKHACDLVGEIKSGSSLAVVEEKIRILQVKKLCRPINLSTVDDVARRSIAVVRSAGV